MSFNAELVRVVRRRANTTREIAEDACAFAWTQFIRFQPDRQRNWRGWLVTTATHEAWRTRTADGSHLSLCMPVGKDEDATLEDLLRDNRDLTALRAGLREALEVGDGAIRRARTTGYGGGIREHMFP